MLFLRTVLISFLFAVSFGFAMFAGFFIMSSAVFLVPLEELLRV
ncbi:MAG: hypothetical protein RL693_2005 [Verrucomicrobiota bacterium]